ncbi:3-phosphoshikimate 1-carboxyvinyltransferase [Candidatus Roizmanbacteria bacterium]|nr:MAG: 3-phosphoshikimate 1-carboxyvinyltransferase [Candidatus Roizmanbacteria bacterium]
MKQIQLKPIQKPVEATVVIPGSKSVTNRALVMAALTRGAVTIKYPLWSDDTEAMIECLQTLGIKIEKRDHEVIVRGSIADVKKSGYELNARLSGTTIRFITALAAIVPGVKKIFGIGRLNERPIKDLVDGLRQMGIEIVYENQDGFPPIAVHQSTVTKRFVRMHGDVSSQYFTALLLIAPVIGGMTIEVEGNQISKSYIDITLEMMREWGVSVQNNDYKWYEVPAGSYRMSEYIVEGDYSAAGYFAGIAALTGMTITLKNLRQDSTQGDKKFLEIIQKMGNEVVYDEDRITIKGTGVRALEVDMESCPDQAQTLAVLAAFAEGVTKMTGVRSLRVKETERVKAVQQELAKMGIRTESPDEDSLHVFGGKPHAAVIDTYHDHRMAMSFAMAGAKIEGMKINDPEVVKKTFPEYWEKLRAIGLEYQKRL